MIKPNKISPTRLKFKGVTLIEMMVAILVLSIGMLGVAGLQAATTKYKINTWARASISTLMSDITERMRANIRVTGASFSSGSEPVTSEYILDKNWATQQSETVSISKNCETTACTGKERAEYDILVWRQNVKSSLPQGAAMLSGDARDGVQVTLMWFDKNNVDNENSETAALVASQECVGTETAMARQSCCPKEADVVKGVRCARFSFIP